METTIYALFISIFIIYYALWTTAGKVDKLQQEIKEIQKQLKDK